MPSDFDQIAANPPGGDPVQQPDPRFGQELQQALGQMREFQSRIVTQGKMQEDPTAGVEKMEINKDGTMKATFHKDTYEALMRDHQELNQIRGAFHQEAERLKQREDQARQQPWAQLATALSANLAQQKDMPGWVRGLGATAAQLNPTADELRNQRMATLSKEAEITEKAGALDIAQVRTEQATGVEARRASEARIRDLLTIEKDASSEAKTGSFDKDLYVKQRVAMGDDPNVALASAQRLEGIAKDAQLAHAQAKVDAENKETAREQQKINAEIRMQDFYWKKNAAAEAAKEKQQVLKEAIATKKDEAKKGQLGAVLEAKVEDILVAKRSTNRLLEIFDPATQNPDYKHFQSIVGPIKGREVDFEKWLGTLNEKDAQLVAKINLQFANAVKTLGAGSYGYRISERGFLQSFTEAMKNGAAQNYGNLKAWSTFYNDKVESFKDIKQDYDWSRVDSIMQTQPGQQFPDRKKKEGDKANDPMGIR